MITYTLKKLIIFVHTDSRRSNASGPATDEYGATRAFAATPPDGHRGVFDAQQHGDASGKYMLLTYSLSGNIFLGNIVKQDDKDY